jgi:predicted permease
VTRHPLDDLDDDIRDHIERETQENIDRGMPPEEARRAAHRAFGNVALAREDTRAVWIPALLDQFVQDTRYALRTMRRQPGFTLAAVAMLAIGLGLVAGGYTVFNGFFVRGWDLPDNARLFRASAQRLDVPAGGRISDGYSAGAFSYLRGHVQSADMVAYRIDYWRVSTASGTFGTHTAGMLLSDNAVEVLGIPLQRGTGFRGAPAGAQPRALLSDLVWRRDFAADPDIVGRTIWLSRVPVTVVGVTAAGFQGLGERPLHIVVELGAGQAWSRNDPDDLAPDGTECCVMVAGRMRDGWTQAQVREELTVVTSRYRQATSQPALNITLRGTTLGDSLGISGNGNSVVTSFALVGAGLVLVLLLTCANVGNLYLARSMRRQREIAVRLSLGASRARVVRQLLTEGLVMAATAGLSAYLMTVAVPIVLHAIEDNLTSNMFASDWRVASFTVAAVVLTCLLVSLAPALQTTRIRWRGATATMSPRTGRVRSVVLAVQIAIAAVLVLSAALLARGILHALTAEQGFALHTTTAATFRLPAGPAYDVKRRVQIGRALVDAAAASAVPIGVAETMPASGRAGIQTAVRPEHSVVEYRCKFVAINRTAADVLELTLASGRWASDLLTDREAVINERLARQIWPDDSPLGKALVLDFNDGTYTVVGVVRDAPLTRLGNVEPIIHAPLLTGLPVLLARSSPGLEGQIRQLAATATGPSVDIGQVLRPSGRRACCG